MSAGENSARWAWARVDLILPLFVMALAAAGMLALLGSGQPVSVPVSSLGGLAAGAALIATALGFTSPAVLFALLALLAGAHSLWNQIALGWVSGQTTALSGLVAVGVVATAAAVLLAAWMRNTRARSMLMLSMGAIVAMLAITGLISDLFPGVLRETPATMATLWRAALVLSMGLALVYLAIGRARGIRRATIRRWLFLPLALALVVGSLVLSHLLRMQEMRALERVTETTLMRVADQLRSVLQGSVVGLDRMAQSWAWRGQPDQNDWNTDTWLFVDHYDEVDAVAWVDPEYRIRWLTPLAGNEDLQGEHLGFSPIAWQAIERSFETREVAISQPMRLRVSGDWGFHVYAPIRAGQGLDGFIAGIYRLEPLLDAAVSTVAPDHVVQLLEDGVEVYRSVDEYHDDSGWQAVRVLETHGASWQLSAQPRTETFDRQLTALPAVTLVFGLLMALLASLAVYQAEINRSAARRLVREVRRRSHSEAALRRSRHDLELRVAARTADLEQKQRELEQTNRKLEEMATTDPLTGLANRRHFLQLAEQALRGAERYDRALSVIMLDLDHFKEVNDNHGHQVGDDVLQAAAEACVDELRDADVCARYGGEEFVILLPETGEAEAARVAERLRERIEQLEFECDDTLVRVTASIGVTEKRGDERRLDDMLLRADHALYRAKELGRNRVVVAGAQT